MKKESPTVVTTPQGSVTPIKTSFRLNKGVKFQNRINSAKNKEVQVENAYGDNLYP